MKQILFLLRDCISFLFYIFLRLIPSKKKATLLYHSVDYVDPKIDPFRMNITPERFEEHLKFLSKYKKEVDITFDDGYRNNFIYAYPLLLKYNKNATIFIVTDFIDNKITSKKLWGINKDILPLTWKEIKTMHESGIKFGSHGTIHENITRLAEGDLEKNLSDSKKRIEEMLNIRVDLFSYPIGAIHTFSAETRDVLSRCGYNHAYTNIYGLNLPIPKDNLTLKRIRINTEDNIFRLKMKMKGAYNWVDFLKKFS